MAKSTPIISIVVPTYNEEHNIRTCLESIISQDYPAKAIEVIVVDNRSTDRTLNIVREFKDKCPNISLIFNDTAKDAEISKMIGLHAASGELFLYLDADIEIVGTTWLTKLVEPLTRDNSLAGSFPRFIPKPDDCSIGRYLRYHPLELDPVFQFFCIPIEATIVERMTEYDVCEFHAPRLPPIGICIYRKDTLLKLIGSRAKFMDIDVPVILAKNGFDRFAYVRLCGIYHTNVKSLWELIKRRRRNIDLIYLPNLETREFVYFDMRSIKDVSKIALWMVAANLVLPLSFAGVWKSVRHRDVACMYEPLVAIMLSDTIAWGFLRNKSRAKVFWRRR